MIVGPGAWYVLLRHCMSLLVANEKTISITFSREGYKFLDFKAKDVWDSATNAAFWAFAFKNLSLSFGELYRDLSKRAFLKSAQLLMPSLTEDMVEPSFTGVMSQVFEVNTVIVCVLFHRQLIFLSSLVDSLQVITFWNVGVSMDWC